jgi:hypothetical protein
MRFAADRSETLKVFLLTSVDLDVGSLGCTENVQMSCDVLWSMSAGIAEIAFVIRVFRSSSLLTGVRNF